MQLCATNNAQVQVRSQELTPSNNIALRNFVQLRLSYANGLPELQGWRIFFYHLPCCGLKMFSKNWHGFEWHLQWSDYQAIAQNRIKLAIKQAINRTPLSGIQIV